MSSFILQNNFISSLVNFPLKLTLLKDWSIIYVSGIDSKKHLQNQLTIDINHLQDTYYKLCAHCNIHGKVWATMFLFHYKQGYAYITRKSIIEKQIIELKKYSVFFDIKIEELRDIYFLGVLGLHARTFLLKYFTNVPKNNFSIISKENKTILFFSEPCERFLLVLNKKEFTLFQKKINKKILLKDNNQWLLLDIEAGFPVIDIQVSQKFLPQSINLDKLKAISLKKGCYYGQEIIAKVFYKNLNKYALYTLIGEGDIVPDVGSIIKTKLNTEWYRIGFLLASAHVSTNVIWVQAVLKKSINIKNIFKISGFKNIFFIKN